MPRKSESGHVPRLFIATETASVTDPDEGSALPINKGVTVVDENDPIYKSFPNLFGPIKARSYGRKSEIEQATAAPGEKRGA
jgi:hypothetical protein